MSDVNLRELVLSVLLSVTRDGAYSHVALKDVLDKYQYLSKQERSFLTRVSMGTLEHMIWIDYVIDQFSKVKTKDMKPVIRAILQSGVYELKFMDAILPQATCNEAVKLAGKKGFYQLKGFVNGVLRNISRGLDAVTLPDREKDVTAYLSLRYSMPEWLVREWLDQYSVEQVEKMLASFQEPAPTCIRVNRQRITREALAKRLQEEGIQAVFHPEISCGLSISGYDHLEGMEAFQEGLFYVQDISSMLAVERLGIKPGDYVLDVCAAPGGKSIHAAELLAGTGMVEARDLTPRKVELIQENIRRCRLSNIRAVCADARVLQKEDVDKADVVIADLPCSGFGVIGKKADIKYKMTPKKRQELIGLQREILHIAGQYVKERGSLLYSTCTVSRMENEENVDWFLKEHPWYHLEWQEQLLPKAGCQDGFFMAKLIREEHG